MVLFGNKNGNSEELISIYNNFREKRRLATFAKSVQQETIKTRQGKRLAKHVKRTNSQRKVAIYLDFMYSK